MSVLGQSAAEELGNCRKSQQVGSCSKNASREGGQVAKRVGYEYALTMNMSSQLLELEGGRPRERKGRGLKESVRVEWKEGGY